MANRTTQVDPSMRDLLDLLKKEIKLELNCHAIAIVQSFNASAQTITANIVYKKTFYAPNSDGIYSETYKDYPLLMDVPVIIIGGGQACLTMPIAKGDECLILFNDRDLDNWFISSQITALNTPRLHNFSDGIALVGLRSSNNFIKNYDTTRAVLRNGDAEIGIGQELIRIKNEVTSLKAVINGLIDLIAAAQVIIVPGTGGSVGPYNLTNATAISNYKNTVANLLE